MRITLITVIIFCFFMTLYSMGNYSPNISQNKPTGIEPDSLKVIDKMIEAAITDSAFPGAVFLAVKDGHIAHFKNYGKFTYAPDSKKVRKNTIYDLASITKVFATTSAAMLLYDKGKLDLNAKVIQYIPEFGNHGKDAITIKHLLTHTSGLPSYGKLWKQGADSLSIVTNLYNSKLENPVGTKSIYSCLGFITLAKVIEKITDQSLDDYLQENLLTPLNLKSTYYNPPKKVWEKIAPTEIVKERNGLILGEVHDENAYYLGGISGNAGLFSNAHDLAVLGQLMLNKGIYDGKRIFKKETVDLFLTKQNIVEKNSHCLGWDTPSGHSSSGHYFSAGSYGHTGFTGTSIWIDPHKNLIGILLTNRVHPTRANRKMYPIRSQIYDKLQQSITDHDLIKNPNVIQD